MISTSTRTSEARRDAALVRLRACGERVTPGRRAVLDVLSREPGHIDAEAVAALVDEVEPGIHRATIYRSLQALVDAGIVTHTHVPAGATIYHLAADVGVDDGAGAADGGDAAGSPDGPDGATRGAGAGGDGSAGTGVGSRSHGHAHAHAHLQCDTCGRFTDVDVAEFAPLAARIKELTGFTLDAGHGALLGRCAECAARVSRASGESSEA